MAHILLDVLDTSESSGRETQTDSLGWPRVDQPSDSSESLLLPSLAQVAKKVVVFTVASLESHLKANFPALTTRFIQLFRRPGDLVPLILDFWPMLPSATAWAGSKPGPDLFYPLSSLKKLKSGRLARLLLEHSRDLKQRLHAASSPRDGVDPPRVAVIDLDEVLPEIIEREYSVSADFYGFVVMVLFLEILTTLLLLSFFPFDPRFCYKSLREWYIFDGNWLGTVIGFLGDILSPVAFQLSVCYIVICVLCTYAVFHGEGTLTLVRRSDVSTPSCAVLLDRDFVLVLTGAQNLVEAIAESGFSISHPLSRKYQAKGSRITRYLLYDALKTACQGFPLLVFVLFWLFLVHQTSVPVAYNVPGYVIVPVCVARTLVETARSLVRQTDYRYRNDPLDNMSYFFLKITIISTVTPSLLLSTYYLAIAKDSVFQVFLQPSFIMINLHFIPPILIVVHFISSQNYRIRTVKLLEILGRPPIRMWEFDTLAAAATFQCLVLCRDIPRPVESIDVLALLDTFVLDERDVWKAWKARVADRIAHEVDISFAPTLPSFRDEDQQKHFKHLLDEAQEGYKAYADFYHTYIPQHSVSDTVTQTQTQLVAGWDDSYWGTIQTVIRLVREAWASRV